MNDILASDYVIPFAARQKTPSGLPAISPTRGRRQEARACPKQPSAALTSKLGGTVRHGEPTPLWEGGEQSEREGSLLLNQRSPHP